MMEKTYDPKIIEQKWYQTWEQNNYFAPQNSGTPYCIVIPPPNVTGSLHMGHGFQHTLMDILIRYHRMKGNNTLWQPGTDHAGIATQMVVERQLMLQGISRHDLGREKFVEKVWEWKEESGSTITQQFRRLGDSVDWTRERFTMDESLSQAVREVFIRLYEEGLIYRGTRLVNWDPKMLTAISDLEVISNEEEGKLWHIRYPIADQSGEVIVATTRPETLLGDTAAAVHPEDDRYKNLIGKWIKLPLTDRTIPIIADDFVDKSFGSGVVKITPAHDFNDYAVGQRHHLTPINIFTPTAHMNENTPAAYQGLERFAARKKIINDLEQLGLLVKVEKHVSKIPRGEKSEVIIEPRLTQQWFIKMSSLAAPAINAVKKGDVKFIPENWSKTYFQWLENIEDWCISRQLWWGHRIPIWHDTQGNMYAGQDENDVRARHRLAPDLKLEQETDVLDTWFSSALWPFSTLGWPKKTKDLETFYPTSVLVTGFDIIFFWVARMIMMGLKFTGQVPFREVFITGLIRDAEGQKMSKSKGNVLDPLDLIDGISLEELVRKRTYGLMQSSMTEKIEKNTRKQFPHGIAAHGTDALRFTFCSLATYGREIRFDLGRLEGHRNFCNKLWNAARYVLMNVPEPVSPAAASTLPNRWILSRLQKTIKESHEHLADYRFDLFAHVIYEFVWNEFCDWYLELTKPILAANDQAAQETRSILIHVLETTLRLLHPIMPFITEEIWQRVSGKSAFTSIMVQPYPSFDAELQDSKAEEEIEWLKTIIITIRTLRSEMNIAPSKLLPIFLRRGTQQDKEYFNQHSVLICSLAKIEKFSWALDQEVLPESTAVFAGNLEILIPMAGLINKQEESARLEKERMKLKKDMEKVEVKLQNPSFVDKAPPAVVDKERAKLNEMKGMFEKLGMQLEKISSS